MVQDFWASIREYIRSECQEEVGGLRNQLEQLEDRLAVRDEVIQQYAEYFRRSLDAIWNDLLSSLRVKSIDDVLKLMD